MISPDENIEKWLHDHRVKVLDTDKRAHRHTKINVKYFQSDTDYNVVYNEPQQFETELLYTIEIAESELKRIADFESQVFNNLKKQGHYNLFEALVKQKERERELIKKYPAVKKAYEQYSLLLNLAESNEL